MMSRLVPLGKLYESLLLEVECGEDSGCGCGRNSDSCDSYGRQQHRPDGWEGVALRFMSMEEVLVWTISGYFASKMAHMYREKLPIKRQRTHHLCNSEKEAWKNILV